MNNILTCDTFLSYQFNSETDLKEAIVTLGDVPIPQKVFKLKSELSHYQESMKDLTRQVFDLGYKLKGSYFSISKGMLYESTINEIIHRLRENVKNLIPHNRDAAIVHLKRWLIEKKIEFSGPGLSNKIDEILKEVEKGFGETPDEKKLLITTPNFELKLSEFAQIEKVNNPEFFDLFLDIHKDKIEVIVQALKNLNFIDENEIWDFSLLSMRGPVSDLCNEWHWIRSVSQSSRDAIFARRFGLSEKLQRRVTRKQKKPVYKNGMNTIKLEVKRLMEQ